MGWLLTLAALHVPRFVRKRKLEMLFGATADAFGVAAPSLHGLSCDDSLRLYACFTREQAEEAIRRGREEEVRLRLFNNAHRIGRELRRDFRVGPAEVMRTARLVYRMLGIDCRGDDEGNTVIGHCFFSGYYTSAVCRLISSLDEGLLVGLAHGGTFSFQQRLTEGADCCRAHLAMGEGE
jgi:hypothetical protein